MCIIVAKPAGVEMPSQKKLKNCYAANKDGFGLAYTSSDGVVHIIKGSMTWKGISRIITSVPNKKSKHMLLHFRIASRGETSPENCHPYPLTRRVGQLRARRAVSTMAIAHNGTILDCKSRDGLSDTQVFILDILSKFTSSTIYRNKQLRELIRGYTKDKFAFLSKEGICIIGDFDEDEGVFYSGTSFKYTVSNYNRSTTTELVCGFAQAGNLRSQSIFNGVTRTMNYKNKVVQGITLSERTECSTCKETEWVLYFYHRSRVCWKCRREIIDLEEELKMTGDDILLKLRSNHKAALSHDVIREDEEDMYQNSIM